MRFNEAKHKLKEIANGEYCSLTYEQSIKNNIPVSQECTMYIESRGLRTSSTWEQVLADMTPKKIKQTGMPGEELKL